MNHASPIFAALLLQSVLAGQDNETKHLVEQIRSDNSVARKLAVSKLVRMGTPAVPALLHLLKEAGTTKPTPKSALLAAEALGELRAQAVDCISALLEELETSGDDYSKILLRVIGQVGPHVENVEELKYNLYNLIFTRTKTGRSNLGTAVFVAIARLGLKPAAPLDDVVKALLGKDPVLREMAAEIIARRGNKAGSAAPALLRVLRQEEQPKSTRLSFQIGVGQTHSISCPARNARAIRDKAALALTRVFRKSDVPIEAYIHLISHADADQRRAAVLALGERGKAAKKAIPTLTRVLRDQEATVVREAITALGMIGPAAEAAIPHLEKLAESTDKGTAARARAAVKQIRRQATSAKHQKK